MEISINIDSSWYRYETLFESHNSLKKNRSISRDLKIGENTLLSKSYIQGL